jgi:hypothetical protein
VDFGDADGAVSGLSHFAIWDAATSGNCLGVGALPGGAVDVDAGVIVKFVSGSIVYTFD